MKRHVCAALVTATLAACGTGGGGGGGASSPVSPPSSDPGTPPETVPPALLDFPTLATVTGGARVSSAITSRPHEHFGDRISATADGAGKFTFTVNDPNVGRYQFRIDTKFMIETDVDPMAGSFAGLQYSAMGVWSHNGFSGSIVAGAMAFGVATGRADLPTTGTATYSGQFLGRIDSDGLNFGDVRAQAQSVANFASGVVSFSTTNSVLTWDSSPAAPAPSLDLTGSMTFQSSGGVRQNSLRGPVSTKSGMTGEVRGNFFGPASASSTPPELAGTVAVKTPGSAPDREGRSMIGGFVMKR